MRPGQQPSGREGEEPWSSQWTEDSLSSIQSPTVNAMKVNQLVHVQRWLWNGQLVEFII